jgi:hypothetical protein
MFSVKIEDFVHFRSKFSIGNYLSFCHKQPGVRVGIIERFEEGCQPAEASGAGQDEQNIQTSLDGVSSTVSLCKEAKVTIEGRAVCLFFSFFTEPSR